MLLLVAVCITDNNNVVSRSCFERLNDEVPLMDAEK